MVKHKVGNVSMYVYEVALVIVFVCSGETEDTPCVAARPTGIVASSLKSNASYGRSGYNVELIVMVC